MPMNKLKESQSRRRRRSGAGRKGGKMDTASLVYFFRKHSTLTLLVGIAFVSLITAYVAIELGA